MNEVIEYERKHINGLKEIKVSLIEHYQKFKEVRFLQQLQEVNKSIAAAKRRIVENS